MLVWGDIVPTFNLWIWAQIRKAQSTVSPPTTLHRTNRALEKEGLFSGAILVSRSADVEFHESFPNGFCCGTTQKNMVSQHVGL